jgi:proprotein convertase subtilisin/kexin type 2
MKKKIFFNRALLLSFLKLPIIFVLLTFISCKNSSKNDNTNLYLLLYLLSLNQNNGSCLTGTKASSDTSDPLYTSQWHLNNTTNTSEDVNVTESWALGITGKCVVVSVVDDGLEINHEDLSKNVSKTVPSYNYYTKTNNPTHSISSNSHGTSVGGIIASAAYNNLGGRGIAYDSILVGRNILEGSSDSDIADALTLSKVDISISNNSWGATDYTGNYNASLATSLWKSAIVDGITNGRNGKGTLYFWAAGNGGTINSGADEVDNSNYDGQANHYGVLSICGVGSDGKRASYSEKGANLWVCGHTQGTNSGYTEAITTTDATGNKGSNTTSSSTDLSNRNYTKRFNGTSAATPVVAGVTALLLSKYPDLSWRDIREILAKSARKNDPSDSDWAINQAGYNISHKYGFGTVDAGLALSTASNWTPITAPLITCTLSLGTGTAISANASSACSNMSKIEFIEVNLSSTSSNTGTITVTLIRNYTSNPTTSSILVEPHRCGFISSNTFFTTTCSSLSSSIRLGSARHLGEDPRVNWGITTTGAGANNTTATLTFYGRAF